MDNTTVSKEVVIGKVPEVDTVIGNAVVAAAVVVGDAVPVAVAMVVAVVFIVVDADESSHASKAPAIEPSADGKNAPTAVLSMATYSVHEFQSPVNAKNVAMQRRCSVALPSPLKRETAAFKPRAKVVPQLAKVSAVRATKAGWSVHAISKDASAVAVHAAANACRARACDGQSSATSRPT